MHVHSRQDVGRRLSGLIVAAVLAACAPAEPPPTRATPPAALSTVTPATPSPATATHGGPSPSPTTGVEPAVADWTWRAGMIEGASARTEISDVWILPTAALAIVRSLDGGRAVGLLRSVDGLAWERVPLPVAKLVLEGGAVIDGELTVFGYTGDAKRPARQVWTTIDGLRWEQLEQKGPIRFGRRAEFPELMAANGVWLVRAYEIIDPETIRGGVYVSRDRRSWTEVAMPAATLSGLASTGSLFGFVGVVIADDPRPTSGWTSPDGEAWTSHPPFPELEQYDGVTALAGTAAGFAAVGQHFVVKTEASQPLGWFSTDGASWEPATWHGLAGPAGEAAPRVIRTSPAGLAARGNGDPLRDAIWISADGRDWTQVAPLPTETGEGATSGFGLWHDGSVVFFDRIADGPPAVWLGSH